MINRKDVPVVSIVGRPNVGKSSLFNRIIGERHALVEAREGTTRDRIERVMRIKARDVMLVDTGGYVTGGGEDRMHALVKVQIEKAITSSDLLLFVCDGESGLVPLDAQLADLLRKSGKKMVLAVNKIDSESRKENLLDFYELGLGEPFGISCLHKRGIKDLVNEVIDLLPERPLTDIGQRNPIKIAIVGRPNVGKSSFLNKVLDEERVIVHENPGTTRDSVDSYFTKDGILFLLIDTAGIRHKRKVKNAVDVYSMMRARGSIDRSDVVLILVDGMEGIVADDAKIFNYVKDKGRGAAIIVNKWDLVKNVETHRYETAILRRMPEARNFPIAFVSAKTGKNVLDAFNLVKTIKTNSDLFMDGSLLRPFLKDIRPEGVKISRKAKAPKFYYMVQARVFPKEFLVFVNDPRAVTGFHTSYIENRLRERFPLKGVPVRIMFRKLRKG